MIYRVTGIGMDTNEKENDLMLEIPEYMTFKDGDVVAFYGCDMVAIIQGECGKTESGEYFCKTYVVTNSKNKAVFLNHPIIINEARKVTEEEKQKLIAALKASNQPKAKEYLKRFFGIEVKRENELKPFDKVLVREKDNDFWRADLFSNMEDDIYCCIGNFWEQCIPYEGNEKLLGTCDSIE